MTQRGNPWRCIRVRFGMDFRIFGRLERRPDGTFRAIASAIPNAAGEGPKREDIRAATEKSITDARVALGRLVHAVSSVVMRRGDNVVWLDVR
jgi:hypothetical protein